MRLFEIFEEYFIKNIENSLAFFAYLRYSLNIKCFDNQSIWMVHRMEPNLETVNDYLVSVFNDILTIEESELKNHNLMIYPLRRCTQSKQLVCTRKNVFRSSQGTVNYRRNTYCSD